MSSCCFSERGRVALLWLFCFTLAELPKLKNAPCEVHNKCSFARRVTLLVLKMSFSFYVQFE